MIFIISGFLVVPFGGPLVIFSYDLTMQINQHLNLMNDWKVNTLIILGVINGIFCLDYFSTNTFIAEISNAGIYIPNDVDVKKGFSTISLYVNNHNKHEKTLNIYRCCWTIFSVMVLCIMVKIYGDIHMVVQDSSSDTRPIIFCKFCHNLRKLLFTHMLMQQIMIRIF